MKERLRALLNLKGSPHALALAFGLGILIGVIPGTGAAVAAVCAALLRLNLPLMVSGALLTNPVTAPFLYLGSYLLGEWLFGHRLPERGLFRVIVGTVAGNLILAGVFAVLGYCTVFVWVSYWRRHRAAGR